MSDEHNHNPLIEDCSSDTLGRIESHLCFIHDYFTRVEADPDRDEHSDTTRGLCLALDMSINALRHEIERGRRMDETKMRHYQNHSKK